jgi:hypothetical protein
VSIYSPAYPFYNPVHYNIEKRAFFKFNFPGLEEVQINYSQLHQDMFVLSVLHGKREGSYLEIGGNEPILNSNSFLLEQTFGWQGVSLEISLEHVKRFNRLRRNKCLHRDATTADYKSILASWDFPEVIDYLSVDCEPPSNTLKSLLAIPHDKFRFRVITFEHDYTGATATKSPKEIHVRDESRSFLNDLGYRRVVSNISWLDRVIEDWWVDPHHVPEEQVMPMLCPEQTLTDHVSYMYR